MSCVSVHVRSGGIRVFWGELLVHLKIKKDGMDRICAKFWAGSNITHVANVNCNTSFVKYWKHYSGQSSNQAELVKWIISFWRKGLCSTGSEKATQVAGYISVGRIRVFDFRSWDEALVFCMTPPNELILLHFILAAPPPLHYFMNTRTCPFFLLAPSSKELSNGVIVSNLLSTRFNSV